MTTTPEFEIEWRPEARTGSLVGHLPDGTVIRAFWLDDRDGIWGEGYGYVATIPGTRRGVHGSGRLATLDDVVREAVEEVARALKRSKRRQSSQDVQGVLDFGEAS